MDTLQELGFLPNVIKNMIFEYYRNPYTIYLIFSCHSKIYEKIFITSNEDNTYTLKLKTQHYRSGSRYDVHTITRLINNYFQYNNYVSNVKIYYTENNNFNNENLKLYTLENFWFISHYGDYTTFPYRIINFLNKYLKNQDTFYPNILV